MPQRLVPGPEFFPVPGPHGRRRGAALAAHGARAPTTTARPLPPLPPQLLLPLWRPQGPSAAKVFGDLLAWHRDSFGSDAVDAPRLSGARLETDREAWSEAKSEE